RGDRLRARRRPRRPAALRHPRVQAGKEAPGPAARPDAGRGDRVPLRRRRGHRRHGGGPAGVVRRHRAGGRRPGAARPADARPWHQPWPTYPMIYRTSSAHEEGGERTYAVTTLEYRGDAAGRVRALHLADAAGFEPVSGTERELPCDLVLLAMGFTGAERPG